jgi:acetyl/propionyl-CoA carboxylase alpha subunit
MKAAYIVVTGDARRRVEIREVGDRYEVTIDGTTHVVDSRRIGGTQVRSLLIAGRSYETNIVADGDHRDVYLNGDLYPVDLFDELWARAREGKAESASAGETILAPIPGAVVKILVEVDAVVAAGQPVAVLEAMKMQNELTATRAGIVREIRAKVGDTVASGHPLIVIAPPEGAAS